MKYIKRSCTLDGLQRICDFDVEWCYTARDETPQDVLHAILAQRDVFDHVGNVRR